MNQGYCCLVAKYKQGWQNYWVPNLDTVVRKHNYQLPDAINQATGFIVNGCSADGISNLVIDPNKGMKNGYSATCKAEGSKAEGVNLTKF
ncbi:MAG: hypothetical protein F6K36_11115 [Symploca sp. SIO3C6]|uniref:Uncharacterized protein n=1 Tax=Symploca sp. SIO1C4 TaxID=2607765 RepID=A0A6B3NH05_9CYAN|nr:hypothetical protein [Symploca sp. SIO3C6]NER30195.1 hypothetical protein [Symploca sp. SIO1C4]